MVNILCREDIASLEIKVDALNALIEKLAISNGTPIVYNNESLSKALNISSRTLSNWRRDKLINYSKVGGVILYSNEDVTAMLKAYSNRLFDDEFANRKRINSLKKYSYGSK